jgi:hypothetical protein
VEEWQQERMDVDVTDEASVKHAVGEKIVVNM